MSLSPKLCQSPYLCRDGSAYSFVLFCLLLWSGQLVSWIGTEVSGIALPLVVLTLTGSPVQAGGVAAMRGLVYVVWAIPAGVLIDRWDRKIVMIAANLGSGLAMGSIALALAFHHLSVIPLYR